MAFSQDAWNQIKAITADELISALERDGYRKDPASRDATIAFIRKGIHSDRIVIHYHPGKTYRPKLLISLFADAGWSTEDDLVRVGLVKRKTKVPSVSLPTVLVACGCNNGLTAAGSPCPECGGTRFKEIPTA
jgi:predicted RNA binding protein YcfA (HicA-like mRNA interferase family)